MWPTKRNYDAQDLSGEILALSKEIFDVEHPDTLESMDHLAEVLLELEHYHVAEEVYRKALKGKQKVLGTKHPDTSHARAHLASVNHIRITHEAAKKTKEQAILAFLVSIEMLNPILPYKAHRIIQAAFSGLHPYAVRFEKLLQISSGGRMVE